MLFRSYKMHRRRQQIVLRPTFISMLTNMRKEIESKLTSTSGGIRRVSNEVIENEMIKAEQSYLLVTHPVKLRCENLPSVPSAPVWAEPGTCYIVDRITAIKDTSTLTIPTLTFFRMAFGT